MSREHLFQVCIIGTDESILEIPCIFCKNIIFGVEAECTEILDKENGSCVGISLLFAELGSFKKIVENYFFCTQDVV